MRDWRQWSSVRWSITLGFAAWLALGLAWTHSSPGGTVDKTLASLLVPGLRAGYWIAKVLLPGGGRVYLASLIASLTNLVLFTVVFYLVVRTARVLRPEWEPSPKEVVAGQSDDDEWNGSDSEEEPVYVAPVKTYATKFGSTIDYEKFKFRTWKLFRKHEGRWPLFSMLFHYVSLVAMLANAFEFFKVRDQNDWSTSKSWIVGGIIALAWCVLYVVGQKTMWRLDCRVFSRHQHRPEPAGRNMS